MTDLYQKCEEIERGKNEFSMHETGRDGGAEMMDQLVTFCTPV